MQARNQATRDWNPFAYPLGFIRLVLLVDWDPIGIFGHAGAMDEYDDYAIAIYDLLIAGASIEDLASYLRRIEIERMGVRGNPSMPLFTVAAKLHAAYNTARAVDDFAT